jgi:preprotein translocase subunit SecE
MRGKRSYVIMVIAILALFIGTIYATDYRIGWFMLKNTGATLACLV